MRLEARWTLTLRDKHGRTLKRRSFRAKSFVRASLTWFAHHWSGGGPYSTPDWVNTSRALAANVGYSAKGAANDDTKGIVVGTGTNAVAGTDYALQTLIADGTGAGQLDYGLEAYSTPTASATLVSFTHTRTFTNNSGGSITIQEVGFYIQEGAQSYRFCFERSLVAGGFAVAAGATVTIESAFKVTY